ncbi:hypothetical protein [Candidatus Absconditicoccus praedator]|uniref:hypothetical protein n=1 Tax=Candidatus Absconditicoccus praedator TaxID=2735562 RepID=UPI001E400248|nr:hypothetical protein [Candidatus Absconditicoccus praedator]UFX83034.1 hypothetical protein HLG78_02765 [Candidatus Absconditicoccus praedator]
MEEEITINAKVAEPTKKIIEDIRGIYKENYPDLSEEYINGYMLEDMLEAFLEGGEEDDEGPEEDDSDNNTEEEK